MDAEIITIGDELLIGQVINTNQAYIAEQLNGVGISIRRMTTVGDNLGTILQACEQAWNSNDIVLATGGLGPTHDDITKTALCRFFATDLVPNASVRERIEQLMHSRGMRWSAAAEEQTLVPRAATLFLNPVGTAPGMLFRQAGRILLAMPGVPYEMKEIMRQHVVPYLRELQSGVAIVHRTLRTTGIAESALSSRLGNLDDLLRGASLAFLPSPRGVRLRVTVIDASSGSAEERADAIEQKIREKVGTYVYAAGEVELEETIGALLREHRQTIATAESCTGGLVADRITNVSGSSSYFERGVITYSNRSKTELLGVPEELLQASGAVSREVAEAMAAGIRRMAGTDIGVSTTGIAGPTGGSREKPVGLVWIGYADAHSTDAVRFQFGDERMRVKERASQAALELVRRKILQLE
jgi:nicotinamide-nucleotide amidase